MMFPLSLRQETICLMTGRTATGHCKSTIYTQPSIDAAKP